jgi:hypothetical protein
VAALIAISWAGFPLSKLADLQLHESIAVESLRLLQQIAEVCHKDKPQVLLHELRKCYYRGFYTDEKTSCNPRGSS